MTQIEEFLWPYEGETGAPVENLPVRSRDHVISRDETGTRIWVALESDFSFKRDKKLLNFDSKRQEELV